MGLFGWLFSGVGRVPARRDILELPQRRNFRHSSVGGDFRIQTWPGGFCTSWRRFIVARHHNGQPRWRIDGFGRTVAISPDGTRLMTGDENKGLAVFDTDNGKQLTPRLETEEWLFDLAWMPDGKICVGSDSRLLYLFAPDGRLLKKVDPFNLAGKRSSTVYIQDLLAAPVPGAVYLCNCDDGKLQLLDLRQGKFIRQTECPNIHCCFLSSDRTRLGVRLWDEYALFDARSLEMLAKHKIPGHSGVRYPGMEEGSSHEWATLPKPDANGQRMLVNDTSGQLWLLESLSGREIRRFPRELVDYVEDMAWLDHREILAALNDGSVCRLAVDGTRTEYRMKDA